MTNGLSMFRRNAPEACFGPVGFCGKTFEFGRPKTPAPRRPIAVFVSHMSSRPRLSIASYPQHLAPHGLPSPSQASRALST